MTPLDPSKMLPRTHIGDIDERPINLDDPDTAEDGEPDNDDDEEDRSASDWLKAVLGFDPDSD